MRRSEGFTLLEVMVALAIAIPSLLLLYRQGGVSLELTGSSLAAQEAISRAQSHLAALSAETLAPGEREGDDGGGYRWRTRVEPISTAPPPRGVRRGTPYAGGTTLYDVTVEIGWRRGRGPQRFVLESRLLGPASDAPP